MRVLLALLTLLPCAVLAQEVTDPPPPPTADATATATPTPTPTPTATPAEAPTVTPAEAPAATPAEAPAEAVTAPPLVEELPLPPPPPPAVAPYPRWGFFLGVGVPQASTLSLIFRPVPYLRLHAGPSWDYLGFGYHGGVTLAPIRWAISPTLQFEAGRLPSFDVTKVVKDADAGVQDLMRDVSITYAAALLAFELGSQRGFCFDVKVGYTWVRIDSKGQGTFTGSGGTVGTGGSTNDATITVTDPTLRATGPTVQLGFQYFF